MNISFQNAKNQEETVLIDGVFLHSSYNPSREAERFIQNLIIPFCPSLIILLEPGLSYTTKFLKNKFPKVKIGVIRYINSFSKYNSDFDFVLNYYEHEKDFENYLFNSLNEEQLLSCFFLEWEPSSKVFSETHKKVAECIKNVISKAKTVLVTRQYFEKKWLLNSLNNIKYLKQNYYLSKKINKPILIISSGPSLNKCLTIIKNNREKFFIICLSSAISVCHYFDIIPDLCMTTDGGFWAGLHLKQILKLNVPLALSTESYCPKKIIQNGKILLLRYNDGISYKILKHLNLELKKIERNGTVSGSALLYALENSTNDIYFCGLDMSNQKGFQHTQPNEIELNNLFKYNKINSHDKQAVKSQFSTSSLDIYKDWFINLNLYNRIVYRIIDDEYKNNSLGNIKDLSSSEFIKKIENISIINENNYFSVENINIDLSNIITYIQNNFESDDWKKSLFPLDFVALEHNNENTELKIKIEERNQNLLKKIRKLLND